MFAYGKHRKVVITALRTEAFPLCTGRENFRMNCEKNGNFWYHVYAIIAMFDSTVYVRNLNVNQASLARIDDGVMYLRFRLVPSGIKDRHCWDPTDFTRHYR